MVEPFLMLSVAGTIANLINLTLITISRAKSLAAFLKSSIRNSLEEFHTLLRTIETTNNDTLTILSSLRGSPRELLLELARTLSECLRVCRLHNDEIDDHLVRILQSRC